VRVTFNENANGQAQVVQEDEYYSFGLRSPKYDNSNGNRYLYNSKELQIDLANQYDYGARFYDPVIGRWNVIDPLAEKSRRFSPYDYGVDNPIRNIDPDGMRSGRSDDETVKMLNQITDETDQIETVLEDSPNDPQYGTTDVTSDTNDRSINGDDQSDKSNPFEKNIKKEILGGGPGGILNNAHISGFYDTRVIGSNYSGNVSGLGFTAIVTTITNDGEESVRVIPIVIGEANFSVPMFRSADKNIAPLDKTLSSLLFQMSYNNAIDEMDELLHNGLAPRLETISEYELRTDFINLVKANMSYNIPGSSFNGYYVKGAAANSAQFYNQ
jgi:RHS repeat-associated protein